MTTRKTIAASVLALAAADSMAQSEVAVSGLLSAVFESARLAGQPSVARFVSNSSFLKFSGAEDMGDGLKAIFQLEGGFDVDNGSGRFFNRDSYVGLQGAFGRVRAGLQTSPMRGMGGRINFVPGSTSIANNIGIMATLNGQATGLNSRMQNSVRYDSPDLNGLVASLIWAPGENRPARQNNYSYGAGLAYQNGPVYAGYAYEMRNAQRVLAGGDSADSGHRLAVRYTLGHTTFGVAWDQLQSEGDFGAGGAIGNGRIARQAWAASIRHTVGIQDFMIHYSTARDVYCKGMAALAIIRQCVSGNRPLTGARQLSLVYQYSFSKRTMLQAYYSRIRNDTAATYDFDGDPIVSALAARDPGMSPVGIGLGIRHEF